MKTQTGSFVEDTVQNTTEQVPVEPKESFFASMSVKGPRDVIFVGLGIAFGAGITWILTLNWAINTFMLP